MLAQREWYWTTRSGSSVFSRSWPVSRLRGKVILVHGLAEHSGRYARLADFLGTYGWQVEALDLPGHGLTKGRACWHSMVETVEEFGRRQGVDGLPLYLYGHSMGAALALDIALNKELAIDGLVASAPPLRLAVDTPGWKVILARVLAPIFPWLRLDNGIDPQHLCRIPGVVEQYLADPLVNSRVPIKLGLELLEIGASLLERASLLDVPLLLLQGGADLVSDTEGSREFCRACPGACQLLEWPDSYHELHNEPEWRQVLASVAAWLDESRAIRNGSAQPPG